MTLSDKIVFPLFKALNYPVDLYYLMDLSNSMSDDRENVVKVRKYSKYSNDSNISRFDLSPGVKTYEAIFIIHL